MAAKKSKLIAAELRKTVGKNVSDLMEEKFSDAGDKPRALATATKFSKSQVQRILAGDVGVSVDSLSVLADVFGTKPYVLLIDKSESRYIIDARDVVSKGDEIRDRDEPRPNSQPLRERKVSR